MIYQYLKSKLWSEQWNIGLVRTTKDEVLEGRTDLSKTNWLMDEKKDGFYADPFIANHHGKTYIFFEQFDGITGHGNICYTKIFQNEGKFVTSKIKNAVRKPFHMSYPNFLRINGSLFLVPETAEANEVSAYRPVKFPDLWKKEKTLIGNLPAVDPTIIKHQGRYWLFCTHAKNGTNDKLYAFYCDELFGQWKPHKLNPIKVDLGSARPAGPLFESNGNLYRPAQDSRGTYGRGIVINEIVELTPGSFKEEKVCTLGCRKSKKYNAGIHTISFYGEFALIDGKRFVGAKRLFGPLLVMLREIRAKKVTKNQ